MKEIILKIPDERFGFFMELTKQLGIEVFQQVDISEEHKAIVRERINSANPEDMIPWEDARKQFTFKGKA